MTFLGLVYKKKNELFNFKRQAQFAEYLEMRKRLRLFKAEMGTLARDDFYEAPAANFHGLKTGDSNDKVTAALL